MVEIAQRGLLDDQSACRAELYANRLLAAVLVHQDDELAVGLAGARDVPGDRLGGAMEDHRRHRPGFVVARTGQQWHQHELRNTERHATRRAEPGGTHARIISPATRFSSFGANSEAARVAELVLTASSISCRQPDHGGSVAANITVGAGKNRARKTSTEDRRTFAMGLFKKAKDAAAASAQQAWAQQQGDGMVHVQGAGPIDPAVIGGPSTRSVAAEDPIWQPINGISLQDYAELAREAQGRGVTDEAGMIALAQERGWNPADTKAALDGWVQRMTQSMAVGQQFRKFMGY